MYFWASNSSSLLSSFFYQGVCACVCMQVCVRTYACVGADKGPLDAMTDRYSQYSTKAGSLSSQICFLLTQAHLVFGQGLGWVDRIPGSLTYFSSSNQDLCAGPQVGVCQPQASHP